LPPPLPASPATPGALSDSRKLLIFGLMAFGQFTRDSRRALAMAQAETGRIVGRQAAAPHRATAPRHTLRDLARRGRTP
jgi:hypothetical protein